MHKKHIVITGIVGWLGGLGTAIFTSSCDTDCPDEPKAAAIINVVDAEGNAQGADAVYFRFTPEGDGTEELVAEAERQRAKCLDDECTQWIAVADGPGTFDVEGLLCDADFSTRVKVEATTETCQLVTEEVDLIVDTRPCTTDDLPVADRPEGCDRAAHPSVWVNVVRQVDDMFVPITPSDGVWFKYRGKVADAHCIPSSQEGHCAGYVAGREMAGRFLVGTDYCDTTFTAATHVKMDEDKCHVETQFLSLEVDTQGCISGVPEPGTDHPDGGFPLNGQADPGGQPGSLPVTNHIPGGDPDPDPDITDKGNGRPHPPPPDFPMADRPPPGTDKPGVTDRPPNPDPDPPPPNPKVD